MKRTSWFILENKLGEVSQNIYCISSFIEYIIKEVSQNIPIYWYSVTLAYNGISNIIYLQIPALECIFFPPKFNIKIIKPNFTLLKKISYFSRFKCFVVLCLVQWVFTWLKAFQALNNILTCIISCWIFIMVLWN